MREITTHQNNALNEHIKIEALDEPGPGGACHQYRLTVDADPLPSFVVDLSFQNGPIKEVGVNGISNEAFLAVLIDRMEGFALGPFPCRENDMAVTRLKSAAMWLYSRTKERTERGVEGTTAK